MSQLARTAEPSLAQRRLLAMPGLERSLMGRHPVSPQDELRSIIAELDRPFDGTDPTDGTGESVRAGEMAGTGVVDVNWDRYGEGGPVAALESQVARLLGKPGAWNSP